MSPHSQIDPETRDCRAQPEGETQEETVRIDPAQAGFDRWFDPDHYYIAHPTLALNTVGLPQLIRAIREALHAVHPINTIPNTPRGPTRDTPSRTHSSRNPSLKTTDEPSVSTRLLARNPTNHQHAGLV
ncbi:hypothetical protein PGTUg99_027109 [Puccinia graminis f. sp. tritici]|uniref:Uncharacterized protein n=1 Tax=Puccinia graminis f. sp. tritici TaxID=56615 RepID=A0A5B0Q8L6_PUCGR|nr:hypothetical protein PGTUg99_027109 [Puccinia graminis f. sp. tritici]